MPDEQIHLIWALFETLRSNLIQKFITPKIIRQISIITSVSIQFIESRLIQKTKNKNIPSTISNIFWFQIIQ